MQRPGCINGVDYSEIKIRTARGLTVVNFPGGTFEMAGVAVQFRKRSIELCGSSDMFGVTKVSLSHSDRPRSNGDYQMELVLRELTEAQRTVLIFHLCGWSDAEIARHLDRSNNTIRNHRNAISKAQMDRAREIWMSS